MYPPRLGKTKDFSGYYRDSGFRLINSYIGIARIFLNSIRGARRNWIVPLTSIENSFQEDSCEANRHQLNLRDSLRVFVILVHTKFLL